MNDIMSIARSLEEGMYILREGEYFWKVNKDGKVDCSAQGRASIVELLALIHHWKTSILPLSEHLPLDDTSY